MSNSNNSSKHLFEKEEKRERKKEARKRKEKTLRSIKLNINQRAIPVYQSQNEGVLYILK